MDITKDLSGYFVETFNQRGQRQETNAFISIYNYLGY
jgi:hypothetical protein